MHSTTTPSRPLIILALATTWLVWGSTFLAIHIATDTIPPFLLMGTRFIVAGSIALAMALVVTPRATWPSRRHWWDASIVGAGLITVSMGTTGWAATRLDTGITALLAASGPLFIAAIALFGGVSPTRAVLAGLAVGMVGVGLLVLPTGGSGAGAVDPLGAGLLVISNIGWALASVIAARRPSPGLLAGSGMQMLIGGTLLLAVSAGVGEFTRFDPSAVAPTAVASWLFLVVVGSLGGYLAYGWLLQHVSTTVASTHAFVNPLVAVALGIVVLGEPFGGRTALAGLAVLAAVILLLLGARKDEQLAAAGEPVVALKPARQARPRRAALRPVHAPLTRHPSRTGAWSPAPTPAFAARRSARPWQATDRMDALAIDDALDQQL